MQGVARKPENFGKLSEEAESILKSARFHIAELEKKSLTERLVGFEEINYS